MELNSIVLNEEKQLELALALSKADAEEYAQKQALDYYQTKADEELATRLESEERDEILATLLNEGELATALPNRLFDEELTFLADELLAARLADEDYETDFAESWSSLPNTSTVSSVRNNETPGPSTSTNESQCKICCDKNCSRILDCQHILCESCADILFKSPGKCPFCRKRIRSRPKATDS